MQLGGKSSSLCFAAKLEALVHTFPVCVFNGSCGRCRGLVFLQVNILRSRLIKCCYILCVHFYLPKTYIPPYAFCPPKRMTLSEEATFSYAVNILAGAFQHASL